MNKYRDKNLIVGLDIGTSKVVALVGEIKRDGKIEIIGIGNHPSKGLKKGVVVNIEETVSSIQKAVEKAESITDCKIQSVYAGIAGSHISSLNSHGIVAIKNGEITPIDINRVINAAQAVAIPDDQRILHILPQEFIIDQQNNIRHPVGMSGIRLEAKVHMITGSVSAAQNISKCLLRCGLEVDNLILEQLASSYSVLSPDEKELGVCLVDIGGGTTDIAVFTEGLIRYTSVIPIAGDQVTNDIAVALQTPIMHAEEIKIRFGCALRQLATSQETIKVPSIGDRPARRLSRKILANVIEPRYEELILLIQVKLRRCSFENRMAGGIVLTGGSSKIEGLVELAEKIFHMPVRLGVPQLVTGMTEVISNPIHATGVGLLLFGHSERIDHIKTVPVLSNFRSIWYRMKYWFRNNF